MQRLLEQTGLVHNTKEFDRAATAVERDKRQDRWQYRISKTTFDTEHVAVGAPHGAKLVSVELNADVIGRLPLDATSGDPFTKLAIDIGLQGQDAEGNGVYFAWHFDRHPDGGSRAAVTHPRYHVQHAGRNLISRDLSWGRALFMETPRLIHPPLDGVLAVDLVLCEFLPRTWARLRRDGQYVALVRAAHHRYWKPYVEVIASGMSRDTKGNGKSTDLWPSLC